MGSLDQNLHVLEHLARHFRFPKSELPSTHGHANAKNTPILENFYRSDQNAHFGESEPNIRKIGNTHQDTKMYIFWRKYILSPRKKKICASFPKNLRIREKIGDLTMKTNFI